jgi:hypothetical protein
MSSLITQVTSMLGGTVIWAGVKRGVVDRDGRLLRPDGADMLPHPPS